MRRIIIATLVMVLGLVVFGNASLTFAASRPYKDVTTKTIDKASIKSIRYVKKAGGFKGVIKGKKFYPNKKMTRRQYLMVLDNLYPGKVEVTMNDLKKANKSVTEKYVTSKMVKVAKNFGMTITWEGGKKKLSRASVANYIKSFAEFDSAFAIK